MRHGRAFTPTNATAFHRSQREDHSIVDIPHLQGAKLICQNSKACDFIAPDDGVQLHFEGRRPYWACEDASGFRVTNIGSRVPIYVDGHKVPPPSVANPKYFVAAFIVVTGPSGPTERRNMKINLVLTAARER